MKTKQELQTSNPYRQYSELIMPFMLRISRANKLLHRKKQKLKMESLPVEEKEILYCVSCLKLITRGDQRIQVEGSHEHTYFNQAGMIFTIGCFEDAQGAFGEGTPTDDFTWFRGYHWSLARCSDCFAHIGWQYIGSGQGSFWGLILNRLTNKKD